MKIQFASLYTAFLKSSLIYKLSYQPVAGRDENSVGEMWLKRFLLKETNAKGETYLTLQSPFGLALDGERQDGNNCERLNEQFETLETINTLNERGAVREKMAFPEEIELGTKFCLFKKAIFDSSGNLVGGGTRTFEFLAPAHATYPVLSLSDNLYRGESAEYAGGSHLLLDVRSKEGLVLTHVIFDGGTPESALTFKVYDIQALQ